MPDFGQPFSGLKHDRMLTHEELVRAIRFMVSAEYEAIQLYQQLAESTDNTLAQKVLYDIADEEKVHAGEFLRLLKELDPAEEQFYQTGAAEVETEFLGALEAPQAQADAQGSARSAGTGLGIGSLKNQGRN
ncbi:MAG: rubrerythrin [Spirochaetales bacterium]|nr:rubrerythrin [Spirochaetales bacterium]